MNPYYHIYLLQLENFNLPRFIRAAERGGAPNELRNRVTWTMKLTAVVFLAAILSIALAALAGWGFSLLFSSAVVGAVIGVLVLLVLGRVFYLPLAAVTLLLWPFDKLARAYLLWRARRKVSRLSDLTVIGITGSYGKTTMKQTLATLLSGSLSVVATDESHNTPIAIARAVLNQVTPDTDIFIVEMGAYQRGDIAQLCSLTPPDIAVLTGINEAHLERFGSLENTVQAKFEIVTHAAEHAQIILNADDETVMANHQEFTAGRSTRFYSAENADESTYHVEDKRFHTDGTGISFRLKKGEEKLGYIKVSHLSDYIIGNIIAGCCVADVLHIDTTDIIRQAHRLTPAEHRLQPIQRTSQRVLVIDDSYNGNPDGAHAAIDVLAKFVGRRTIYVTPGLVEMGEEAEAVHRQIGEHLAAVVDVVVLVETSVTDYITAGLESADFSGELIRFTSPQEMQAEISGLLQPGDVLLFQNDWPENYR